MKKTGCTLLLTLLFMGCSVEQTARKPKLAVGIVVDQMRYDYLVRFYDQFGEGGFKKLMNEGFVLKNAHYNYIPTATAPGHASIYTGSTPSNHGIISNSFYDKNKREFIYCMDDDRYHTVGGKRGGQKSLARLETTTIMDQLKLAQSGKGKTIGISIKDRSAMLPAGHSANAAYWFGGGKEGHFITSSFYMESLPNWVRRFNELKLPEKYLSRVWDTDKPIAQYTQNTADDTPYERPFNGEKKPTFPHDLPALKKKNGYSDLLKETPFGNDLLLDFAKATIEGEQLGKGKHTDFISISFSSTDYVGHRFGTHAVETTDTYIRLDRNIADLINFLDVEVGKGNYTLFLTADHAAVPNANYLKSLKIPSGFFQGTLKKALAEALHSKFGQANLIANVDSYQVFLNHPIIKEKGLDADEIASYTAKMLIDQPTVYKSITAQNLHNNAFEKGIFGLLRNGYNQKHSGDVLYVSKPNFIPKGYEKGGTSHGTGYNYDTHVPVIFYGNGIQKGSTAKRYEITDIAPTMAHLLSITFGNFNSGIIIEEAIK